MTMKELLLAKARRNNRGLVEAVRAEVMDECRVEARTECEDEIFAQRDEIATLKKRIAELEAQLAEKETPKKKGK